jgi:very-short-patch-repair endonuclease
MPLGPGQEGPGFLPWRRTLTEALMLGIRETMQAGRRDLEAFEVAPNGEPKTLVIFDTMPGGTGYLPKLLAEGGAGLREVASTALERLGGCDCEKSCHRCLRDFWNQRHHRVLDRHAVIETLRHLATAPGIDYEPEPDEQLASFLEREFFERLEAAGIQAPTLQGIHRLPDGRITVADAVYADPDISVYLDGREYHSQSVERIRADLHRRNQLEQQGQLVLEFTYSDVLERFDDVAASLREALQAGADRTPTNLPPNGLVVTASDLNARRLDLTVNAYAWVRTEAARQQHLNAANAARLAGWRLHREVAAGDP